MNIILWKSYGAMPQNCPPDYLLKKIRICHSLINLDYSRVKIAAAARNEEDSSLCSEEARQSHAFGEER